MFKFAYDLIIEPLGLPIAGGYEWLILVITDVIAYRIAYSKVGRLYDSDMISGRTLGSFLHWLIRTFYFFITWAVTYGVILIGKFVIANKVLVGSIAGIILLLIIAVRILLWKHSRNELLRVKVEAKESDIEE